MPPRTECGHAAAAWDGASVVRNTCRTPSAGPNAPTFELLTTATAHQQRAMALIQAIRP